jgi:phosphatidylglycerophosphate synthase
VSRYRDAVTQLSAAQKPGRGAPPYSRWINRPLGRRLAAVGYVVGLTPNQITAISAVCSASALLLLVLLTPRWWTGVLVAALLVLGYAFDAADGQLARLRGGGSLRGEWLDHVVDAAKNCLVHTAVLIAIFRFVEVADWVLLIPLGYQLVSTVFFFTFILMEKLRAGAGREIHRSAAEGAGIRDHIQTLAALPTDYGILCVVFVLSGLPSVFIPVYGTLFALSGLVLCAALFRWWRELGQLDRSRA